MNNSEYDFESFVKVSKIVGQQLTGHCPFHDDANPSFSANKLEGLWHCYAGCGSGNYEQFSERIKKVIRKTIRKTKRTPGAPGPFELSKSILMKGERRARF